MKITKARQINELNYLPHVRVAIGGGRGVARSRERRVDSLAASMEDKGVAFGCESLSGVFTNRSFDSNVNKAQAQQSESRAGTGEPHHWSEASGATERVTE